MSILTTDPPAVADSPSRARAWETLWRLSALALAHPVPEFHAALASGAYREALDVAWARATDGDAPPAAGETGDFTAFEAGYISAFLHGRNGRPVASLMAGDHEGVLGGLSRPVFMLNLSAFYRHFGLQAATGDEGRRDEPDHVASLMEFMAVLCHLEAGALERGGDPAPPRRAQRDVLGRFLGPTLATVAAQLREHPGHDLDPTLAALIPALASVSRRRVADLEGMVGSFRDPETAPPRTSGDTGESG
ncbi:molecular chaperone TorD family protein [Rhodospira trueperi]|uniref:DMSO reductase family type II enzyme chaperone n=1 Tax=Rhodospira trueperi TaxID=69960 RepID=A0A1G7D8H7_9PROT|nr:molecular chaperone TorD family protein [Rhodospira trueperi]SDE47797.1 DMSO reductase family type II enzyme chaperone [Rhodospira trueperi]